MSAPCDFDPRFVDFDAYARGIYTPPPALVALAAADSFWSTFGGSTEHGRFGDDGETERQRATAKALGIGGYDTQPVSDLA